MSTLFTRHSPGALTLREAVEREKKRVLAERKRRKAEALAKEGRGGDTEIVHVARGEMVIPRALQTPELMAALSRAAARYRVPLQMLSVGNAANSINPNTGVAEFDFSSWLGGLRKYFGGDDDSLPSVENAAANYDFNLPGAGADGLTPDMFNQVVQAAYMPIDIGQPDLPQQSMRAAPFSTPQPIGPLESLKYGFQDPGAEAWRMSQATTNPQYANDVMSKRDQFIQMGQEADGRSGIDLPRWGGRIAANALLLPELTTERVISGAAKGGMAGALKPVPDGDSGEKAWNVVRGAVVGGGLAAGAGLLPGAAGNAVSEYLNSIYPPRY